MKKVISLVLALLLVFALCACGSSSEPAKTDAPTGTEPAKTDAPAKTVTLTLANSQSENSTHGIAYQAFADAVYEKTNGTVKIECYHSSTLINDQDVLDSLIAGTVDIGHSQTSYLNTVILDLIPFDIPGACRPTVPNDDPEYYEKFNSATTPLMQEIMGEYGLVYLGSYGQASLVYVGNKQVNTAADLQGALIRTSGSWGAKAVEELGGTAMTIPIADVTMALQRGTVDLVNTSWTATQSFQFYDSSKYLTITPMAEVYTCLVFSQKSWNEKLNDEQRAAIQEAWDDTLVPTIRSMLDEKYEELQTKSAEAGCEIKVLSVDEAESLYAATDKLLDEASAQFDEKGLELLEVLRELRG